MRRRLWLWAAAVAVLALPWDAHAAGKKDAAVLGMSLEPPGLDPTAGAAAAIGEITHFNIFEGLTKVNGDGSVTPLLAESWTVSPDFKTYTFKLRQGVKFQDGEPFTSEEVKFSFERAAAEGSTNKDKAMFANMAAVETPDPDTVAIVLEAPYPDLLFHLGLSPAVVVDRKSAAGNAQHPVGTGPFVFESWSKGASVTLAKWAGYRAPASVKLEKVMFRFISDPAAQVAALLAGDLDAFPRFGSYPSVAQLQADPRFTVTVGATEGKTIVSINNKKKPFDDVRVRRALAYAIDRKAVIDGALNGFGTPIGSHYVPIDPDYIDLTGTYPYDPEKAKALLKEAGIATPLEVSLKLPPPAYARQGGEVIAAELAKVGIVAKIENLEWPNWLDGVFKNKNFDLTIISHVEPHDLAIYANPNYYFQYDSPAFREIMARVDSTLDPEARKSALEAAQRQLATDAVNVFLFQLPNITVANKDLKGLWKDSATPANDMAAVSWQ
jgi:peptide/nickel transport system substrate-binding protein